MTAATFKKIAQAMANAKIEIHIARPPYPSRSTTTPAASRLGNFVGCLTVSVTPIFNGDFGRHQLRKLLGLRGHRLDLLVRMSGRQLDEFRGRLHPQQRISVVKGGVGIGAGDLDDLEVVVCGALGGGRIGVFELVRCFLGDRLRFS